MVKLLYYKQISRDIIEDVRKTTRYNSSVLMISELYIVSLKGMCKIFLGRSGVSCRSFAGEMQVKLDVSERHECPHREY